MALAYPAFVNNSRIRHAAINSPSMSVGEYGPGVAILQAALIDVGYKLPNSTNKTGRPDGHYGKETKRVVIQFQTDKKLSRKDGSAGRETFTKLDLLLMASAPIPPGPAPPPPPPPSDRNYTIGTTDPKITPDPGAGIWNSKATTVSAVVQRDLILEILPPRGSSASLFVGDDAARHMKHYLDASGRTLTIDLEGMVDEVATAKARFQNEAGQAKTFVESLAPGVNEITSKGAESAYNFKKDNYNWFFAVGGYATWGKGKATVKTVGTATECELLFEYKFFDRYNWDSGKSVEIAGITITDDFMAEFHRQGIAQEFDMIGSFKRTFRWKKGDPIPAQQFLPSGER